MPTLLQLLESLFLLLIDLRSGLLSLRIFGPLALLLSNLPSDSRLFSFVRLSTLLLLVAYVLDVTLDFVVEICTDRPFITSIADSLKEPSLFKLGTQLLEFRLLASLQRLICALLNCFL